MKLLRALGVFIADILVVYGMLVAVVVTGAGAIWVADIAGLWDIRCTIVNEAK